MKKLTINTLALGNLKRRRKQYTILIIGIILAMIFSSGIMFFYSCMRESIAESKKIDFGNQEVIFYGLGDVDFENTQVYDLVSDCGYARTIGFAYKDTDSIEMGAAVTSLDKKAKELSYLNYIEGGYPEKNSEIAIERTVLINLGLNDKKIGDKITLNMLLPNSTDYLEKSEEREFTLVGIVGDRKRNMPWLADDEITLKMFPGAYVCETEETPIGGKEIVLAYCNLIDFEGKSDNNYDVYNNAMADAPFSEITVERWTRHFSTETSNGILNNMAYSMVFACVLTLVSCLAIVNSFGNNLRERKTQIGMLRAVGATKRQIIRIFARESFIISIICVPVSIAISYFSVKLITFLLGENFVFMPKTWILFAGAGVGVVCVLCASLIPLLSTTRISPMQAIRNVELSRKMKNKKIRSQKNFKVPSLIAKRNITFFRSRQIAVSIILAITIACSCFGFSLIMKQYEGLQRISNDYSLWCNEYPAVYFVNNDLNEKGFNENDRAELVDSKFFSEIDGYKNCVANIVVDEFTDYMLINVLGSVGHEVYTHVDKGLTKENYKEKLTSDYNDVFIDAQKKYGYDSLLFSLQMSAFDEDVIEDFEDMVEQGRINIDKINSGEEIILVCPEELGLRIEREDRYGVEYTLVNTVNMNHINDNMEIIETAERSFNVDDEITLSVVMADVNSDEFVRTDKKVKIGAIINEAENFGTYDYYVGGNFLVLTSIQGIEHFAPGRDYGYFSLWSASELNENLDEDISGFLSDMALSKTGGNYLSEYQSMQSSKSNLNVFLYAMIAVILLFFSVCGSVINNALSARIREGKKEIGTLRAVGADQKTLVSSYVKQLLSMFGWGYGIGFTVYTLGHITLKILEKTLEFETNLKFQIWQIAVMCIVLFSVCAINLTLKIRKEMKHSIVENIREL